MILKNRIKNKKRLLKLKIIRFLGEFKKYYKIFSFVAFKNRMARFAFR